MPSDKFYLYKRPNGFWYIGYCENGKRRWKSTSATVKSDALRFLSAFEKSSESKIDAVTLSEFVTQFCSLRSSDLRTSTVKRIYLPAFSSFQRICGNKPLPSYTLKDVEMYKSMRLGTCSPVTVNIEFRTLRAAFNLALKWKLLRSNPFEQSSQLRIPERLPVYFSKEDFKKFIAKVQEPFLKDLFLFAALTGLRLGEILNLDWQNIHLERRLIVVANSECFLTKTGRCRLVPMSNAVTDILSRREATRGMCAMVFHAKGERLQHSYVQHKFKKYVRQVGLSDALRFHSLRHTFATWLVEGGVNIYEVQKLLGHKTSEPQRSTVTWRQVGFTKR